MGQISIARKISFGALEAVENGAYASDILRKLTHDVESRDASLASNIVFGCLRRQNQLDFLIQRYSGRPAEALDPLVRVALRAAIFQIRYLERIPAHAAVHESVEYVKLRNRSATGFTNAVLRKVNRSPVAWPNLATELACPAWLIERWTAHFGAREARNIAEAALREPVPYVRIPPGSPLPAGIALEPTPVAGCFRVVSGQVAGLRLHDISSQAIIPLLDLQPGNTYLDLCAAPGNKTVQALETPLSLAIACDVSFNRIAQIPEVCPRVVLDATAPLPFRRQFDRIFIDAPCSGTGTLGRNPEIKWRVQKRDFLRFQTMQTRILFEAAKVLAPGGKLLYATCSLEREENEAVVEQALWQLNHLKCESSIWRLPGRDEGDGFFACLLIRKRTPIS